MKAKYLLAILALFAVGMFPQKASAATINLSNKNTTINVAKNTTQRIYFKTPARLKLDGKAEVIDNQSFTRTPYSESSSESTYYLRRGHYYIKASTPTKVNYTNFSKVRGSLETYSERKNKNNNDYKDAVEVPFDKNIYGFVNMYNYDTQDTYKFTIDSPQKITFTGDSHSNLNPNLKLYIDVKKEDSNAYEGVDGMDISYRRPNGTFKKTWYLAQGTYYIRLYNSYGLYNFKLKKTPSDKYIPGNSSITDIHSTGTSMSISYAPADKATGYEVRTSVPGQQYVNVQSSKSTSLDISNRFGQVINGAPYTVWVRGVLEREVPYNGQTITKKYYGLWSEPKTYTFYMTPTGSGQAPEKVNNLKLSPTFSGEFRADWDTATDAQSYQIAFKEFDAKNWSYKYAMTNLALFNGYKNGQTVQVKIRALNGNLYGPWSDVKTIKVQPEKKNK